MESDNSYFDYQMKEKERRESLFSDFFCYQCHKIVLENEWNFDLEICLKCTNKGEKNDTRT